MYPPVTPSMSRVSKPFSPATPGSRTLTDAQRAKRDATIVAALMTPESIPIAPQSPANTWTHQKRPFMPSTPSRPPRPAIATPLTADARERRDAAIRNAVSSVKPKTSLVKSTAIQTEHILSSDGDTEDGLSDTLEPPSAHHPQLPEQDQIEEESWDMEPAQKRYRFTGTRESTPSRKSHVARSRIEIDDATSTQSVSEMLLTPPNNPQVDLNWDDSISQFRTRKDKGKGREEPIWWDKIEVSTLR